jgi:cephalosporin hydroxylase
MKPLSRRSPSGRDSERGSRVSWPRRMLRHLRAWWFARTVRAFHIGFYRRQVTDGFELHWMGTRLFKNPFDLWMYQEILAETRPDLLIETGTRYGGSALFFAHCFERLGHGEVVSVDITHEPGGPPVHPRITYLLGSSIDPEIVAAIEARTRGKTVMVSLDSDHSAGHVLAELRAYGRYVSPGHYLVCEDGNVNGHPVLANYGAGPSEALATFLGETTLFEVDRHRQRLLLTFNPGGWLRRRPHEHEHAAGVAARSEEADIQGQIVPLAAAALGLPIPPAPPQRADHEPS